MAQNISGLQQSSQSSKPTPSWTNEATIALVALLLMAIIPCATCAIHHGPHYWSQRRTIFRRSSSKLYI
ncbi:hypothetical protein MPH_12313 [Macrophomina phaseolina MS6]|uniref:Uncharacterized protein n=1 Tax=Macrophomina phaseolina (strain MS6) TaxID=1126212 RepID=K2S159_MACPH|nr:hypothetical protein MPH_12313 [Macrophomina phaseolina MS6]